MAVIDSVLTRNARYMVISAVAISVAVSIPRLGHGIPMSVDTGGHLYRVLFLERWMKDGNFPFWSPDWYAGFPAFLLYPPLSYYLPLILTFSGIDPLFAYKLVDALFYALAPVTVYLLGREFGLSKGEAALASVLYSLVPEVIDNYLFFDRFPTVLSVPIFCVTLILIHRALTRRDHALYLAASIAALSALILTHHLSALMAGIAGLSLIILHVKKAGIIRCLTVVVFLGIGALGVTAFWFMPFLASIKSFAGNPFFNPNVKFPFIRFLYFGFDIASYLLGISQFLLATVAFQSILGRSFGRAVPIKSITFFLPLLGGMGIFQVGELLGYSVIVLAGQAVVILMFVMFLGQLLVKRRAQPLHIAQKPIMFVIIWFVVFLWMGLGFYAFPVAWMPYISAIWVKTMDVYRIWFYLAIPLSLLAGYGLVCSIRKVWIKRRILGVLIIALVTFTCVLGAGLKVNYALSNAVDPALPYSTANASIPKAVISYFEGERSQGRILGINVPFWVYLLPNYVNKPIIDGWYPQSKLIPILSRGYLNDYRLDDLQTAPNSTVRIQSWRFLIDNAELLDITWVMIGGKGLAQALMNDTDFTRQLVFSYPSVTGTIQISIFKASRVAPPIQLSSRNTSGVNFTQPNPDLIRVNFTRPSGGRIIVKEAYFPTWMAEVDGKSVSVARSNVGYMAVDVPKNTTQLVLYQAPNQARWTAVSIVSLIALAISMSALILMRRRGT